MAKKIKPIKAEKYKEDNTNFIEDDYFEDDNEFEEEIKANYENTFKVEELNTPDEQYEDAKETFRRANLIKIYNIVFIVIIILAIIISTDIVCVTKYNIGPFFSVNTKTYKDGGTKEYYGLGYKVIKYNELVGRKDIELGFWNLEYKTNPLIMEDLDLAIEFQNNPEKTADKYYNEYVMITSTIKKINKKENKLILEYPDPDKKYTLEIICNMDKEQYIEKYNVNENITIKGTIKKFMLKTNDKPNQVVISNCFIH